VRSEARVRVLNVCQLSLVSLPQINNNDYMHCGLHLQHSTTNELGDAGSNQSKCDPGAFSVVSVLCFL
jgi:hypothetical protein